MSLKNEINDKTDSKIRAFQAQKNRCKLVCLTAYSFPTAKILDKFCDLILVGDSLGMTFYGLKDTTEVSLEMMIEHSKAVSRAISRPLLVVDMPFATYETKEQALKNARRIIDETGCDAVKIETDLSKIEIAEFLVNNQIPVMGHIGLLPQNVKKIGGYRYQGKEAKQAQEIIKTALDLEKCGVFSLVIEAVPAKLAEKITKMLKIPTIGIGASLQCDGQILVLDDVLGMNPNFLPKFAKSYENLAQKIENAVQAYGTEVRAQKFPDKNREL